MDYSRYTDMQFAEGLLNNDVKMIEYFFKGKCFGLFGYNLINVFLCFSQNNWYKVSQFDFRSKLLTWVTVVAVRFFQKRHKGLIEKIEVMPLKNQMWQEQSRSIFTARYRKVIEVFNDLLNNGVSEEILVAYIDGNITKRENQLIESSLDNDSILFEIYEMAHCCFLGGNSDYELHKGDFGFWELELLLIVAEGGVDSWQDYENVLTESNMPIMFKSQMHVYGEAGENISDPIFIQQPDDHSCGLRSQQIVLRDFGIDIPFDKLEQIALDNGVYTNDGTYTYDIGKVLELSGVSMHQVLGSNMHALMNELAQGHRVIVSVDAYELWNNGTIYGKLKNWFDDVSGSQGGNHALIVAGVEVNPGDVSDIKVVLTDPDAGHLRIEYTAEQFVDAWSDSNCFMVATDTLAPYQYDASTGMEIPSNFAVQQHFNQFVEDNSFQLSPDLINIPHGYQPIFTGYLEMVGNMSFDSFKEEFERMHILNAYDSAEDGVELFFNNIPSSSFVSSSLLEDNYKDEYEVDGNGEGDVPYDEGNGDLVEDCNIFEV